jgi:UDP-N-acetylmuramyl pentapeptide phosphotransferase/UDP-N-acetylglucosamine-1-phosphate transferase
MSYLAGVVFLPLLGAVVTAVLLPLLLPLLRPRLTRSNFAGAPVVTGAGLAPALATAVVALAAPHHPLLAPLLPPRQAIPLALAALLFAGLGLVDDLWGSREVGGLRGHLRRLTHERRLTTGLLKAVGGALAGIALAVLLSPHSSPAVSLTAQYSWVLLTGAWIALAANAINLLDLRPLRATKGAFILACLVVAATRLCGGPVEALAPLLLIAGVMAPYLPREATCRVMLGDAGANFLGAAVAVIGAAAFPSPLPLAVLTGVLLLLHAWTERHSVSAAIAARPWLARLDAWGWRATSEQTKPAS